MPRCVIINCNSPKISSSQRQGHISYHSFPHDPIIKEKWIAATGRKDWFPTKHSTICSIHFENTSFIEGKKLRLLKKTACPTIDILKLIDNDDEDATEEPFCSEVETVVVKVEEEQFSEEEEEPVKQLKKKRQRKREVIEAKKPKLYNVRLVEPVEVPIETNVTSSTSSTTNTNNDQELTQNPDPKVSTFLRFLGAKMQKLSEERRKELQDRVVDMILNEYDV